MAHNLFPRMRQGQVAHDTVTWPIMALFKAVYPRFSKRWGLTLQTNHHYKYDQDIAKHSDVVVKSLSAAKPRRRSR